jgi:hypothetical protein
VAAIRKSETQGWDLDGNLTSDGRWTYTWDGENRLISMTTRVPATGELDRKMEFEYDCMGSRIGKKVYSDTAEATLTRQTKFLMMGGI